MNGENQSSFVLANSDQYFDVSAIDSACFSYFDCGLDVKAIHIISTSKLTKSL